MLGPSFNCESYGIEPAIEICFLVSQRSARVPDEENRQVGVILVFPDDLGGSWDSGPTSIWALQEFRSLEGLQGGRRDAEHPCQMGESDHRRPLGIFSIFCEIYNFFIWGGQNWFRQLLTTIRHCLTQVPCTSQSATTGLSSKFWGETSWNSVSHSTEPPQQDGLPSLASAVSSLRKLFKRWKDGKPGTF